MKTEPGLFMPGGKTGVLLLHDAGGSAAELKSHAAALSRVGYTVACPQLIALGSGSVAGQGSAGLLVSEAEQALSRLKGRCENVVVVGLAYGAMLGLELARHNAGSVQAVVLVEPRLWLPSLPFSIPSVLSGRIKQSWLAPMIGLLGRTAANPGGASAAVGLMGAAAAGAAHGPAQLQSLGKLLDSVHAGLPAVKQPVLLVHSADSARGGRDGSFLLQRQLGGRVESVMLDDVMTGTAGVDGGAEALAERAGRFISSVLEELETRRGNELRRKKVAEGRTSAA